MKSLFLAALAAFALFSSAATNAQQYRDRYYDSHYDSYRGEAHVLGALIDIAVHSTYDGRPNYYRGGNGYRRDHRYDRHIYAPRYRGYRQHNRYTIYPGYRTRNYYPGYRGRRH